MVSVLSTVPDAAGRLENLKELVRAMEEFPDLSAFLEHVSLVMEADESKEQERVSIMTLHGAKGLEFETVYLPGWEEGLFPHQRSLDEQGRAGLEEERRLAYVGLTRARHEARVSYAANRRVYNEWKNALPSRFISELPDQHVERSASRGLGMQPGYQTNPVRGFGEMAAAFQRTMLLMRRSRSGLPGISACSSAEIVADRASAGRFLRRFGGAMLAGVVVSLVLFALAFGPSVDLREALGTQAAGVLRRHRPGRVSRHQSVAALVGQDHDVEPRAELAAPHIGIDDRLEGELVALEHVVFANVGKRLQSLGLAMARSIVDLHGGTIRCESDGQHGTTFTFTLPRRPL